MLSEFRSRVIAYELEEKPLDLLLSALQERGMLAAGGKQRTDSTHVISAVRDVNRVELAGEFVRAALEALAVAAPGWVQQVLEVPGWAERYELRAESWPMPTFKTKQEELARVYGTDGYALVEAVYAPFSPAWLRHLPAVDTLRVMLIQNYVRSTDRRGRQVINRRQDLNQGGEGLPPGQTPAGLALRPRHPLGGQRQRADVERLQGAHQRNLPPRRGGRRRPNRPH